MSNQQPQLNAAPEKFTEQDNQLVLERRIKRTKTRKKELVFQRIQKVRDKFN